jgi:hypothetical protein
MRGDGFRKVFRQSSAGPAAAKLAEHLWNFAERFERAMSALGFGPSRMVECPAGKLAVFLRASSMKEFNSFYPDEFTPTGNGYVICGRAMEDEPIALGDKIGGCRVVKIEAYGHSLDQCHPGLSARITLEVIDQDKAGWLSVRLIATSPDSPENSN